MGSPVKKSLVAMNRKMTGYDFYKSRLEQTLVLACGILNDYDYRKSMSSQCLLKNFSISVNLNSPWSLVK